MKSIWAISLISFAYKGVAKIYWQTTRAARCRGGGTVFFSHPSLDGQWLVLKQQIGGSDTFFGIYFWGATYYLAFFGHFSENFRYFFHFWRKTYETTLFRFCGIWGGGREFTRIKIEGQGLFFKIGFRANTFLLHEWNWERGERFFERKNMGFPGWRAGILWPLLRDMHTLELQERFEIRNCTN